jgi:hypothetical protein
MAISLAATRYKFEKRQISFLLQPYKISSVEEVIEGAVVFILIQGQISFISE